MYAPTPEPWVKKKKITLFFTSDMVKYFLVMVWGLDTTKNNTFPKNHPIYSRIATNRLIGSRADEISTHG